MKLRRYRTYLTIAWSIALFIRKDTTLLSKGSNVQHLLNGPSSQRITEDRVVGTQNLRPDLVIQKNKEILILDVVCPFDQGLVAFVEARRKKIVKYIQLAGELFVNGISASVEAMVVSALSSWDPANNNAIKKLYSRSYARLIENYC